MLDGKAILITVICVIIIVLMSFYWPILIYNNYMKVKKISKISKGLPKLPHYCRQRRSYWTLTECLLIIQKVSMLVTENQTRIGCVSPESILKDKTCGSLILELLLLENNETTKMNNSITALE